MMTMCYALGKALSICTKTFLCLNVFSGLSWIRVYAPSEKEKMSFKESHADSKK